MTTATTTPTTERCGAFCYRERGLHVHGHTTGGCRAGEVAVVNLHGDWSRVDALAQAGLLRAEHGGTYSFGHVCYYYRPQQVGA